MKAQASPSRKIFKPTDLIIAAVAATVLAASFLLRNVSSENCSNAAVFYNGTQIASLSLKKDAVYPFDEYGVTVEIKDGKARVSDSDCPDGICEKTGFISSPMQTIVCLPNHISVRMIGSNDDTNGNIDVVLN